MVDVPAKRGARVRLFDTGHNRETDAHDAHSIAMVAVLTKDLRVLALDGELKALPMLVERRESLSRRRVQTVDRLQALLAELLPGQAKKDITTGQAKRLLASVRPRDIAGKTRRRIAAEELAELVAVEARMKKANAELKAIVLARGSHLMDLHGVGPVVAARILADVGDVARFADRNRFASWTGTAPLDASSGEQNRHRLSRAGNRRVNHMIHIAAISQIRLDTPSTDANEPKGRSRWKRSGASSAGSPTRSTTSSSPTPPRPKARTREGTAGRLLNPARSIHTRNIDTSDSHSRTRDADATPAHDHPEEATQSTRLTQRGAGVTWPLRGELTRHKLS